MGEQDQRRAEGADEGAEPLHHRGTVELIERDVAAAAGPRPIRHHGAIAALSEEIGPSEPAIGGALITSAGMRAAVHHDDGRATGRGHGSESLEIDRHRRSDQPGLVDHGHDDKSTAEPNALREHTLVSRFRRSYHLAAPTFTNVGNRGTLASRDPSVALGPQAQTTIDDEGQGVS